MGSLSIIKIIGAGIFASKQLKLPSKKGTKTGSKYNAGWKNPKSLENVKNYAIGLKESKKMIPLPPKVTPPFFMPQNPNMLHTKACNDRGKDFKKCHDDCLDAVKFAVDMWKLKAKVKDLKVMAVSAIGSPGCLDGPKLESDIKNAPAVSSYSKNWKKYRDAVAKGVSKCYEDWQAKVTVPGLPWYPAFAAYPGPTAAPTPNIPVPIIICPSAKLTSISMANDMKKEMINALPKGLKKKDPDKQHEALFEAIGTAASVGFLIWLAAQQVMLVLGKGPVPTFAPPYVPVGPVVAGDNTGSANCIS